MPHGDHHRIAEGVEEPSYCTPKKTGAQGPQHCPVVSFAFPELVAEREELT